MQRFTKVRSTADYVEPLEILDETVIVRQGITQVTVPGEGDLPDTAEWEIEVEEIYEKNEYIHLISEQSTTLEATVDSILTDVIPSLMGTGE